MTYPHIKNKLERTILANALINFRQIKPFPTTCKNVIFLSEAVCGIFDECIIEAETWTLKEVNYAVWKDKKLLRKTIPVS